jgi:hypothetical protein
MRKLLCVLGAFALLAIPARAEILVNTNDTFRLAKGLTEASSPDVTAWRLLAFNDAAFSNAPSPFWYDASGDTSTLLGGTVLSDMQNAYSCIFLRKTFVVTNLAEVSSLQFGSLIDDGYVAWINGVEVVRANVVANPPTIATLASQPGEPAPFVTQTLAPPGGYLINGTNVLAVQVFNTTLASSDLDFYCSLISFGPDTNAPTLLSQAPVPGTVGSLPQITVTFSESVQGVSAGDLLVNGLPATGVSGSGATYTFTLPALPYGPVNVTWDTFHGITDFGLPTVNNFDHAPATWSYTLADQTPPTLISQAPAAGSTVLSLNSVQVSFSEPVQGVNAADLMINGSPATNVNVISPSVFTFEFAAIGTGAVTVAFDPGHGIADLANPSNLFAGATWNYTISQSFPTLHITEFLAVNSGSGTNFIRDEDGDAADWVEIYNPNLTPESLAGWFLTDKSSDLTQWKFPGGAIVPAGGYIVVYASGKNRTNNPAKLHTNFQLNNSGEYLGLVNPLTNVVSHFAPTYPSQSTDVSYGRDRTTPSLVGYYTIPTPGSNNVSHGAGFGPDVHFSRDGGTYVGSFQLTLTADNTNCTIRYVLVSAPTPTASPAPLQIPTTSSTLYTGPITITNSVQVRARAFPNDTNLFPGDPHTECYIPVDPGITNYYSSLPIVVIHTLGSTALSGGYPAYDNLVTIMAFDNDGGTATLLKPPQLVRRAGINLRGSSTQGFPKSSYAVELWDDYNTDDEDSFLGLPKESDWVLYAPNQFDVSLMHNPLLHNFATEMGYYSSRTRFVEVFFRNNTGAISANTNATGSAMGDYAGVYVLEEKVKRDGNRVDIDEVQSGLTNHALINGGYLLKIDRADGNERTFTGAGVTIVYQDPDGLEMVTAARTTQSNYLNSFFNQFNTAINFPALTNATGTNHYSYYLDFVPTIDFHIANTLTLNVDGYRLSGYLNKPRDGKMIWGPLWDCDRGQGTTKGDGRAFNPRCWQASNPSGSGGTDNGTDFFQGSTAPFWLGRVFADLDFWQLWIDRYQMWRTSVLDTNHINAVIDGYATQLRQAQVREAKRWTGGGNSDTSPRNGTLTSFNGDYSHAFPGTYQGEVDFQKRWYIDRVHFFDTNLLARPTMNLAQGMVTNGTTLTLTDNSGKPGTQIYYTLNGSDPRAPQGLTNPAAILYTGPITITGNVRVRARAVNPNHSNQTGVYGISGTVPIGTRAPVVSSRWSGDNAVTYFTAVPQLAVTELMFNPAPPPAGNTNDADNYEFIELKNIGSNSINLVGFRFTNGIDFTFTAGGGVTNLAPGGYVLVVRHLTAFTNRYGARTNIAGEYTGNLDNGGERVTLVGAALELILDFTYSDSWQNLADGTGFSLVLADENAPFNTYTNAGAWRRSSLEFGSAGTADSAPRLLPQILVSEVMTHSSTPVNDQIELWNPGTTNVDVTGWFLSDSFNSPKKFLIPSTVIPAGGFAVFTETQFGAGPNGFGLGSDGDQVYVFSGEGGLLSGHYHGFDYGAAATDVTFGRYLDSQTNEHFVAQSSATLGSANALPLVGPVVISEVHYHPPETGSGTNLTDNSVDEFVELLNISASPVSLFHTNHATNTWRLTKGVDFDFPTNVIMPAGGYLLVVNFNPATDTNQLALFRAKFGVSPAIPVYGPLGGKLDNSGETVKLSRPDVPNPGTGLPPFIEVDRVEYRDSAPWTAAADGFGASLQRIIVGDFGNDPTNWLAALPTPGQAPAIGAAPGITQHPAGGGIVQGNTMTLSVTATGAPPLIYQWRLNGTSVPGATNATLLLSNIQYSQSGTYVVAVLNAGGSAVSSNAVVNVTPPVIITVQPLSHFGPSGTNVTFSVVATGSGVLRYQWRFNGNNIAGATNASLAVSNATLAQHGTYVVRISDDVSTVDSLPAQLYIRVNPVITVPPLPVTVMAGANVTMSVTATGAWPHAFRWLVGGTSVSNIMSAATPLSVTITRTNAGVIYYYPATTTAAGNPASTTITVTNIQTNTIVRIAVTNLAGSTASGNVTITVLPDADQDGMPDAYEVANGLNPAVNDAALDADGDTMTNYQEFIAGTDPNDPLNYLRFEPLFVEGGTNTLLRFTAVSNRTYTVQTRDTLGDTNWSNLFNISATATNRVLSLTNNVPGVPTRFYRLAVQPQ